MNLDAQAFDRWLTTEPRDWEELPGNELDYQDEPYPEQFHWPDDPPEAGNETADDLWPGYLPDDEPPF